MDSLRSSQKHKYKVDTHTHPHTYTGNTLTQEGTCYQKLVPLAGCQKKRAEANTNPL